MQGPASAAADYRTQWDPRYLALVQAQQAGAPAVDRYALAFPQAREMLLQERRRLRLALPVMQSIEDERIPAGTRTVALRFFRPVAGVTDALVLYLHGGGWCVGCNETHDTILRHLAHASGVTVCGVEYALAPEAPFPAALQEVAAVTDALLARLPSDTPRLVLAGDSAGANLALVEAMRRRDAQAQALKARLAGLVLFYGVFGPTTGTGSHRAYGGGAFGLSLAAQERYLSSYLGGASPDWRVFPLWGDLYGLPPLHIQAAELDLLRDDSLRLHEALVRSGSRAGLRVREGVPHGYLSQANHFGPAREDLQAAGRFIAAQLGLPARGEVPRG